MPPRRIDYIIGAEDRTGSAFASARAEMKRWEAEVKQATKAREGAYKGGDFGAMVEQGGRMRGGQERAATARDTAGGRAALQERLRAHRALKAQIIREWAAEDAKDPIPTPGSPARPAGKGGGGGAAGGGKGFLRQTFGRGSSFRDLMQLGVGEAAGMGPGMSLLAGLGGVGATAALAAAPLVAIGLGIKAAYENQLAYNQAVRDANKELREWARQVKGIGLNTERGGRLEGAVEAQLQQAEAAEKRRDEAWNVFDEGHWFTWGERKKDIQGEADAARGRAARLKAEAEKERAIARHALTQEAVNAGDRAWIEGLPSGPMKDRRALEQRHREEIVRDRERMRQDPLLGDLVGLGAKRRDQEMTNLGKQEAALLAQDQAAARQARIAATKTGYDLELSLLADKHAEERRLYRQAGREEMALVERHAAEVLAVQRRRDEANRDLGLRVVEARLATIQDEGQRTLAMLALRQLRERRQAQREGADMGLVGKLQGFELEAALRGMNKPVSVPGVERGFLNWAPGPQDPLRDMGADIREGTELAKGNQGLLKEAVESLKEIVKGLGGLGDAGGEQIADFSLGGSN